MQVRSCSFVSVATAIARARCHVHMRAKIIRIRFPPKHLVQFLITFDGKESLIRLNNWLKTRVAYNFVRKNYITIAFQNNFS